MKKRVMALICAAMLVGSMSLTALAAPSVSGGVVTGIDKATDKNGNAVDVEGADAKVVVEKLPTEYAEKETYIKDEANLKKELGSAYKTGMKVLDVKNVKIVGGESVAASLVPVTITFKVTGVKTGDTVICLHWTGSDWEKLDTVTGEGTVKVTFNSLSPVAFIKVDTGSTTSPTTGEPIMVVWAIAAIVAGAAGIAYTSKKRA